MTITQPTNYGLGYFYYLGLYCSTRTGCSGYYTVTVGQSTLVATYSTTITTTSSSYNAACQLYYANAYSYTLCANQYLVVSACTGYSNTYYPLVFWVISNFAGCGDYGYADTSGNYVGNSQTSVFTDAYCAYASYATGPSSGCATVTVFSSCEYFNEICYGQLIITYLI